MALLKITIAPSLLSLMQIGLWYDKSSYFFSFFSFNTQQGKNTALTNGNS